MVVQPISTNEAIQANCALTHNPSIVESGRLSLLCEPSMTHYPPLQVSHGLSLSPSHMTQLTTWSGRFSQLQQQTLLDESNHCPTTLVPSLESQATVTQLNFRVNICGHKSIKSTKKDGNLFLDLPLNIWELLNM